MDQDYGLWPLVIINSILLIVFAGSFFHPRSKRDWRAMGAYSAFIVALFTEIVDPGAMPVRRPSRAAAGDRKDNVRLVHDTGRGYFDRSKRTPKASSRKDRS